ncbi:CobW family GTP-binding protein [Staphylococcus caprae]|uniref:CobW family GTP-binding protein n=1 Tax=Staphylococcus caprae TaxID=29380 RepID=UPI003B21A3E0
MRNNKDEKISISIISGFLGSGKTTLLTHYMSELLKIDEKISVIMNEFGSFDVDGNHLTDMVEVYSILNGCVCCDLKLDLVNQLEVLINEKDVNHIIIEATGIAHPIEIIMACQDPRIVQYVHQPQVIGVVDAERFLNREQYTESTKRLMEEQLEVSNVLIVNKIDLINEEEQQHLEDALNRINANVPHILTTYGKVDVSKLSQFRDEVVTQHTHSHHHGINSMQYTFSGPIDRQLFYQFILRLPDEVLRLKGYVQFRDHPNATYEFQYAYGLPDYGVIDKVLPLTIVIIGEQLDVNRLRNKLDMLQFS